MKDIKTKVFPKGKVFTRGKLITGKVKLEHSRFWSKPSVSKSTTKVWHGRR